ncbi:arginine repressor [Enterococcus aquimarinus]|uniref:Arginine repressor n=1 Tax=Enterococcus aquimarinus TaxID=328396 RepID=A0A1L8QRW8_9ENTE|nr:ArgR family transcriptional regulator [Enterococcus aquimarinus]MBP6359406.1 ArgR family transcriptional regulator [Enterococcus sp.]MBP7085431.1 ArgR family transcriptional regulator [Enterococcus sp.]MBP7952620.1 ArgR family transcriptional regulator [Enterococcus sp.]MBP8693406.1 ArgR family transcriptional regulator [Enterococcus sp.]MBP9520643.1 ArgR family transcriptional regulator [Enterococcus sp.]
MKKKERQRLLTRFLTEHEIQKQEEFVDYLKLQGIEVTQATISRDIKELKLIKVPSVNGGYRYSLPNESQEDVIEKLNKLLQTALVSVDQMEKFVILRTLPGNASAVGNLVDKYYQKELFSSLNDDDKVLMITWTEEKAVELAENFRKYQR